MFWITENHFLFVGLFDWGNAETQTSSVYCNRDSFAVAESRTRKSGTVAPPSTHSAFRFFKYKQMPLFLVLLGNFIIPIMAK